MYQKEQRVGVMTYDLMCGGTFTPLMVEKVIFNNPATIVLWSDKTKTVVKCMQGDTYSQEIGLAMCICKKVLGSQYHRVFKEWITYEPE